MKIETKRNLGDTFYRAYVNVSTSVLDFIPCPECEGKAFFRGKGGQKHPCQKCANQQTYYPYLPNGWVPGRHDHSIFDTEPQTFHQRIFVTRETVDSIKIDREGISYVYDIDYEGDLLWQEVLAADTVEEAIELATREFYKYERADRKISPGVIFNFEAE